MQDKRLAVYPERLRHVFISDVYFRGATSLSPDDLIHKTANRESTVISIICAKALGGIMDGEFLKNLIDSVPTSKVCEVFCTLGQNETEWVTDKYPQHLGNVAQIGLNSAPSIVIPKLLDQSPIEIDNLHSNPSAELRQLQDWCWSGYHGQDAVSRRNVLLETILAWYDDSKEKIVAAKALQICMHPGYEGSESDPGLGMTLTIRRGHITKDDLKICFSWWNKVLEIIKRIPLPNWGPILELVDDWAYPGRHGMGNPTEEEFASFSKEAATRMLKDLSSVYPSHNGIKQKIQSLSKNANLDISVEVDEEFDALYPIEDLEDYENSEKIQRNNADNIISSVPRQHHVDQIA